MNDINEIVSVVFPNKRRAVNMKWIDFLKENSDIAKEDSEENITELYNYLERV